MFITSLTYDVYSMIIAMSITRQTKLHSSRASPCGTQRYVSSHIHCVNIYIIAIGIIFFIIWCLFIIIISIVLCLFLLFPLSLFLLLIYYYGKTRFAWTLNERPGKPRWRWRWRRSRWWRWWRWWWWRRRWFWYFLETL